MSETTAIVVSIVGTGIGIIGVMGLMIRVLTTNIGKQFDATSAQMKETKADLSARIDETNKRIDDTKPPVRQLDQRDAPAVRPRSSGARRKPRAGWRSSRAPLTGSWPGAATATPRNGRTGDPWRFPMFHTTP